MNTPTRAELTAAVVSLPVWAFLALCSIGMLIIGCARLAAKSWMTLIAIACLGFGGCMSVAKQTYKVFPSLTESAMSAKWRTFPSTLEKDVDEHLNRR